MAWSKRGRRPQRPFGSTLTVACLAAVALAPSALAEGDAPEPLGPVAGPARGADDDATPPAPPPYGSPRPPTDDDLPPPVAAPGAELGELPDDDDPQVDADVDRRLDQALEREYGSPRAGDAPPTTPRASQDYKPVGDDGGAFYDEDPPFAPGIGFRFAFWLPKIEKLSAIRESGGTGSRVDLGVLSERDYVGIPRGGIFLDLAEFLTIDVDYYYADIEGENESTERIEFFDGELFADFDELDTETTLHVGDADLKLHVISNDWITLGLDLGAKLIYADTKITRSRDESGGEVMGMGDEPVYRSKISTVIPYLGAHLSLRPGGGGFVIFGSVKAGLLDYREGKSYDRDGDPNNGTFDPDEPRDEVEHEFFEFEAGASYVVRDTFGISISYFYQVIELKKIEDGDKQAFDAELGGIQISAFLRF